MVDVRKYIAIVTCCFCREIRATRIFCFFYCTARFTSHCILNSNGKQFIVFKEELLLLSRTALRTADLYVQGSTVDES